MDLSVVLPVFNEEANLRPLFARLLAVLERRKTSFELIFVDDGSSDDSLTVLESLHLTHPHIVRVISFSRNFGQHAAIIAGLDYAAGARVVIMDADLQDLPEEVPKLLDTLDEGYDCVYGIRKTRAESWFKRASSQGFWYGLRKLTGHNIPANQGMLRAMNRGFVDSLLSMPDQSPFIAGMFAWVGGRQATVDVEQGERLSGDSKYTLAKMIRLMWTATTSFTTTPLKLASYLGFLFSGISLVLAAFFLVRKLFFGYGIVGWSSLMVTQFLVAGIQLLVLGIMGEYLARVQNQTLARPRYLVHRRLGPPLSVSQRRQSPGATYQEAS